MKESPNGVFGAFGSVAQMSGFLAGMAALIRPRRCIIGASLLLLGISWGMLWFVSGLVQRWVSSNPLESNEFLFRNVLDVPLGMVLGIFYAGLLGGMSYRIAKKHKSDILTVFFGGVFGAGLAYLPCNLIDFANFEIFSQNAPTAFLRTAIGIIQLICTMGAPLLGFWFGGKFVTRVASRDRRWKLNQV
jgi:hypothetical protein